MLEEHLDRVFGALTDGAVRYLVVGGLAVVAHGHPRFTADLDLVVALDEVNVHRALQSLGRLGYKPLAPVAAEGFADPRTRQHWSQDKGMQVFQLLSEQQPETGIDIFVQEPFDFDREYAGAPRIELVEGRMVPVVAFATLLAMKRAAGRPRDLEDVATLERIRSEIEPPDI